MAKLLIQVVDGEIERASEIIQSIGGVTATRRSSERPDTHIEVDTTFPPDQSIQNTILAQLQQEGISAGSFVW